MDPMGDCRSTLLESVGTVAMPRQATVMALSEVKQVGGGTNCSGNSTEERACNTQARVTAWSESYWPMGWG